MSKDNTGCTHEWEMYSPKQFDWSPGMEEGAWHWCGECGTIMLRRKRTVVVDELKVPRRSQRTEK